MSFSKCMPNAFWWFDSKQILRKQRYKLVYMCIFISYKMHISKALLEKKSRTYVCKYLKEHSLSREELVRLARNEWSNEQARIAKPHISRCIFGVEWGMWLI